MEVEDESHLHAGHPGAAAGGGHFRAVIVADCFEGLSRVAAQRLVYQALADEMRQETDDEFVRGGGSAASSILV